MTQLLLTWILEWVSSIDFKLENYSNDSPIGWFLEINFDYPNKLHNFHYDYPLASEKVKVT